MLWLSLGERSHRAPGEPYECHGSDVPLYVLDYLGYDFSRGVPGKIQDAKVSLNFGYSKSYFSVNASQMPRGSYLHKDVFHCSSEIQT